MTSPETAGMEMDRWREKRKVPGHVRERERGRRIYAEERRIGEGEIFFCFVFSKL